MGHRVRGEGFKSADCGNSIRERVEPMLVGSGLWELFDWVLSNEDMKPAKPDPEIYLTASERLGIQPHEAMIVEDAPHGVEAGRRSGGVLCQVTGFNEVDYARVKLSLEAAG